MRWIDSDTLADGETSSELEQCDGILIPGGFGERGIEGKIRAAQYARENGVPYLGICLGMQIAVAEFARHVAGMDGANSTEFDPETPYPVVDLLPEQKEVRDMGGTMRLGADPVKLHEGTRAREIYGEPVIYERHRHRYEVNNHLRKQARGAGPGVLGHLARRPPGRDHRAARPPVLRGVAVPPRVQVASAAPAAAVPRLRGRRAGARARTARPRASPRAVRHQAESEPGRPEARAWPPSELGDEFARLCEIESASLASGAMADAVAAELRACGLEVEEDASGGGHRLGLRQPARAHARPGGAPHDPPVRAPGHRAAGRAGRGGARGRRLPQRQ